MERLKQETAKSMGGEYTRPYEDLAQDIKSVLADFSLDKLPPDFTAGALVLNTTLADIMVLAGKFTLGKTLFDLEFTQLDKELATARPRAIVQRTIRSKLSVLFKFLRYPNLGWWLVHLVAIAVVFGIGAEVL